MPWKLILFILSVVLVTIFIGFNLTNACDVSLGVYTFKNVPIFMSILLAFALGVFIMLPFTFGHSKKENRRNIMFSIKFHHFINSMHPFMKKYRTSI